MINTEVTRQFMMLDFVYACCYGYPTKVDELPDSAKWTPN